MKKLSIFFALFCSSFIVFAQNVGINTVAPVYRLQVEEATKTAIYARTQSSAADTSAIRGVLDNPTLAGSRSAGVRGITTSTTSNSIGVYGTHAGGGWGVAGSTKEAGVGGGGSGVYGEAGLGGLASGTGGNGVLGINLNPSGIGGNFQDLDGSATSRALKTSGKVQLTGVGEAAGKALVTDNSGNASWGSPAGTIASTQMFAGSAGPSYPTISSGLLEFVGPTATITLTANQRVVLIVMAALGRTTAGSALAIYFDVGYQSNAGGAIQYGSGSNYLVINPAFSIGNERGIYNVQGTFKPGAGAWKIGMVMANGQIGNVGFFNSNDWLNATYMIIND